MPARPRPKASYGSGVPAEGLYLPLAVEQLPHVLGSRPVSLTDPMHIATRHLNIAVAHPLADRRSGRHRAELGGHEVPEPVQRLAVAEVHGQLTEPARHRVHPQWPSPASSAANT
jgi:hypothetical protein